MENIKDIIENQRKYFHEGHTLQVNDRIENLMKLRKVIQENEAAILEALNKDLGKSNFEGYLTEVGIVLEEIGFIIKNLRKWNKPKRVKTSIGNIPSKNYLYREPYGVTLIISPWNYPFQLTIAPLIGAIAGGNTAVIKPSRKSANTSRVIAEIMDKNFDGRLVKVVNGVEYGNREILKEKYDYIFFTGSVGVGKVIMETASKHLTEVTLELGGKSPCIIDKDTNIDLTCKRVIWGKFLNVGQTCVCPDYVLVHEDVKDKVIEGFKKYIKEFYGDDIKDCSYYGRIIDEDAFDRLVSYIDEEHLVVGGDHSRENRYIAPTIMDNIDFNHRVMQEEIFGPILPMITYKSLDEIINIINARPKPLALYYFSKDKENIDKVISKTSSGGLCINDTIMHVASSHLSFGGVGESGMGKYHGRSSFDTFTHEKSIVRKGFAIDIPVRYAPYKESLSLIKKILK
ncbi:MAG: aldehyde dehydrogenase [Clostridium sp.]|uniref:aldehyde dehydrogenase n=1 Tax=Clostridium sp. TaxID=1506 RepID=UPI00306C5356